MWTVVLPAPKGFGCWSMEISGPCHALFSCFVVLASPVRTWYGPHRHKLFLIKTSNAAWEKGLPINQASLLALFFPSCFLPFPHLPSKTIEGFPGTKAPLPGPFLPSIVCPGQTPLAPWPFYPSFQLAWDSEGG